MTPNQLRICGIRERWQRERKIRAESVDFLLELADALERQIALRPQTANPLEDLFRGMTP